MTIRRTVAPGTALPSGVPAYKKPKNSAAARAKDLLSRMSLEEKAAQMMCVWQEKAAKLLDAQGDFDLKKARAAFGHGHGIGQVGRPGDAGGDPAAPAYGKSARGMAELTNAIQKFFLEQTRLGVPVLFHEECLRGHAARDGTSFPQPIGLAGTFDPELVERLFAMTAKEARLRGAHQALTPVVDVTNMMHSGAAASATARDPNRRILLHQTELWHGRSAAVRKLMRYAR